MTNLILVKVVRFWTDEIPRDAPHEITAPEDLEMYAILDDLSFHNQRKRVEKIAKKETNVSLSIMHHDESKFHGKLPNHNRLRHELA